ncbi:MULTISPECIES: GIY-YIG nuclease family protein [Clostridia]|uniref:GIY-YIG nuclease family protein n=1 Tax=Clostridia TaxID=186801 RepID=UPI000EA40309|nr:MULTISPECIES: GIY-YIG nuclease family protein [Clostridia]NBJ70639.1 GIY-YIG nuclease family protein [Roseburia sp. 1XD42-34]RKI75946.1 GIY-YIG nuclease family protein [Clostridium sp. 1xD42-85]
MSVRGKSINLYLMDGSPNGRIKCTLANWTGIAYKIPRPDLEKCKNREDLSQSGVYFLFGMSDINNKNNAYIGQASTRKSGEGILSRLFEHKRDPKKDYWTEAVVFTTSNNSFGPTEISYLENRFCRLARQVDRYIIRNDYDPASGNITEEKESELEEFIDYAKIIMGTLGHKIFEPLTQSSIVSNKFVNGEKTYYLHRTIRRSNKTIKAICKQTREGFVVLKGSQIEISDSNRIPRKIKEVRKNAQVDKNGVLQKDMLFNSPSYAASFVIGGHANGLIEWKTESGFTLKEIENNSNY